MILQQRCPSILCALVLLLGQNDLAGQWIYSVGVDEATSAPQLQRIHLQTQQVVSIVNLTQPLGDIAFHPDGTLYGVYIDRFYEIDTITGDVSVLTEFPTITFMTGLTIDHRGVFYISAGAVAGNLYRYDPVIGTPKLMGVVFNHMDAAFYNGELYVAGILPETFGERSHITRVDTTDFSKSEIIVQYEKWPGLALASYSNPCGSRYLVSPTIGYLNYFFPPFDSIRQIAMPAPFNFQSAGAASRNGYLGSLPPLEIDHLDVIQDPCDTNGIAIIQVIAKPGREGVEFSLNGTDYQDSYEFVNVPPGTYTVYIRDELGCSDISDPIKIVLAKPVTVSLETTSAHCFTDNGTAVVHPAGGSGGWMFSLDGGSMTSDSVFTDLEAGLHAIIVTDQHGCTAQTEFEIETIAPLTFSYTTEPEICSMGNASITLSAGAGVAPYTYSISTLGTQDNGTFTGLKAGSYIASVVDALGCTIEKDVEVPALGGPVVTGIQVEDAHCGMADGSFQLTASGNGQLMFSLNGGAFTGNAAFQDVAAGMHVVTVQDEFGCETVIGVIVEDETGYMISDIQTLDATCDQPNGHITVTAENGLDIQYSMDGVGFQTDNSFTGLAAGTYMIWTRDAFGCQDSTLIYVDQLGSPVITGVFVTPAYCGQATGEIVILAEGGAGDLYFALDEGAEGRSPLFTELPGGTYAVTVRDENYCMADAVATIDDSEGIMISSVDVIPTDCGSDNGVISLVTDGAGVEEITLDGHPVLSNVISDVSSGAHELRIMGENGCVVSRSVFVPREECGIFIPNVFSANNDGINDVFSVVYDPAEYTLDGMRIVDRWGAMLFDCKSTCSWDGTVASSGEKVDPGVYLYRIVLIDVSGEQLTFMGDITVMN